MVCMGSSGVVRITLNTSVTRITALRRGGGPEEPEGRTNHSFWRKWIRSRKNPTTRYFVFCPRSYSLARWSCTAQTSAEVSPHSPPIGLIAWQLMCTAGNVTMTKRALRIILDHASNNHYALCLDKERLNWVCKGVWVRGAATAGMGE